MRQFRGKFLVRLASSELRRFRRNEHRLERFLRISLEQVRESHFFRNDISYHDERQVVRDVARFVILHHLFLRKLVVNLDVADHWEAIRMPLIRGREKEQTGHAIGVIHAHGKFAANHFLLFLIFLWRQSRIHHRIGQHVERGGDSILRRVDPENGPIKGRVSVDVTAHVLNLLRDLIGRSRFRPLEEHVLENMGQARAQVLVLVDATRGAPRLHTCHRRAVIFLNDDREPVCQNPLLSAAWRESDRRRILDRGGFQIGSAKHTRDEKRHTRRESHHTDFGAGNSTGGFAIAGFSGANGFTKASSKS